MPQNGKEYVLWNVSFLHQNITNNDYQHCQFTFCNQTYDRKIILCELFSLTNKLKSTIHI